MKRLIAFATIFGLAGSASAGPINFLGLDHTALGSASLAIENGSLVVSDLGLGGEDGVLVDLPSNTDSWDAHFDGIGSAQSYAPGSFLQVTGIATVDGIANRMFSGRATVIGSQWALSFDFSQVSSAPLLAKYFFNGVVISEEIITTPNPQWITGVTATDGGVTPCPPVTIHLCSMGDIELTFKKASASLLTPSGQTLLVDGIDVLTTDLGLTFGGYSAASLTAAGIPTFTINSEDLVTQPAPEPSMLVLFGAGLAGFGAIRRLGKAKT